MRHLIERLEEASGEWGVMWTEFNKSDRIVKKKKFFDSEAKRDAFAEKIEKSDSFNEFSAWSKPTEKDESMDAVHESADGLKDFQRESANLTRAVGEAVNQAIKLKGMWDRFEEIPTKQKKMYDRTGKVMIKLGEIKNEAGQTQMELKKYK